MRIFGILDTNQNSIIEREEYLVITRNRNLGQFYKDIEAPTFEDIDIDKDGLISLRELVSFFTNNDVNESNANNAVEILRAKETPLFKTHSLALFDLYKQNYCKHSTIDKSCSLSLKLDLNSNSLSQEETKSAEKLTIALIGESIGVVFLTPLALILIPLVLGFVLIPYVEIFLLPTTVALWVGYVFLLRKFVHDIKALDAINTHANESPNESP